MYIQSIYIDNFKCYRKFSLDFTDGINILVGDNEAGKTTILEAITLGLSGLYDSRYVKNSLSQHLFNKDAVDEYLTSISEDGSDPLPLPSILIEIYFNENSYPSFLGNDNVRRENQTGLSLCIEFDENYQKAYETLLNDDIKSLPIEFYKISWSSFSRDYHLTSRQIPIKPLLIDSSNHKIDFPDSFISKVVRGIVDEKSLINIAQAYRQSQDVFTENESLKAINQQLQNISISTKNIRLSISDASVNAWENVLTTYLNDIPFDYVGKGEQCILKTRMSLARTQSDISHVIMIEEPENHLSHSKLNEFIELIKKCCSDKQIIISTHSSFVANKLGLKNLILLANRKTLRLSALSDSTVDYFEKLAGYDTLRLILCKRAILVEGSSDELVVQKAFYQKYNALPISKGTDVISVGNLSFLRFLEIAALLSLNVAVVTDNDGNIKALRDKYSEYLDLPNIRICYDGTIRTGDLMIGDKPFNYNTMEPCIAYKNGLDIMNKILCTHYSDINNLHKYMKHNKVECALKIFESDCPDFIFPDYIMKAIDE